MTAHTPNNPQPVRRGPSDPRSHGPSIPRSGAPVLKDPRSTGGPRR